MSRTLQLLENPQFYDQILKPKEDIFKKYNQSLKRAVPIKTSGSVKDITGIIIEASGPFSSIGDICYLYPKNSQPVKAEVVGFKNGKTLLMPFSDLENISPGVKIVNTGRKLEVTVGREILGRILSGDGKPADSLGNIKTSEFYSINRPAPSAYERKRIDSPIQTGVRAIDGTLTVGKGQRMGIFAGSGVGKSTLLGMIAKNTSADVNVIALIGERGREVREFIEKDLGEEGLKRSVLVVVTSNEPPLMRIRGAFVATAIAEYFRDQNMNVMFMMDSVTRFAMAQRELGLAVGEPPATKGYPPSVFNLLPKLLERTGTSDKGTITAFYTVLVEGDDVNEPVSDTVRGILDGHIVLSRDLAHKNHYPAIDVLGSISRLINDITDEQQRKNIGSLRKVLSNYKDVEDLLNINAYVKGSNPDFDDAISKKKFVDDFLQQDFNSKTDFQETISALNTIFSAPQNSKYNRLNRSRN